MWYMEFIEVYVLFVYSNKKKKNCARHHWRYIDFRVMFINKSKCVRKYAHILDMLRDTRDIELNGYHANVTIHNSIWYMLSVSKI